MGNTVVWKPAFTQIYSARVLMEVFLEAGLPAGVINLIYVPGAATGDVIFSRLDFAGIHSLVLRVCFKMYGNRLATIFATQIVPSYCWWNLVEKILFLLILRQTLMR